MTISIKQIHSVLSTYNKQLKLTTSVDAKRKQIYQQAVSSIVNKLTKNDTLRSLFFKYTQKY